MEIPLALSADVTISKVDVGLGNVDNTSDLNKPVSTATQTALNGKEASLPSKTGNAGKYLQVKADETGFQYGVPVGGSAPTGTGWRHITGGVEDTAASTPDKTDVGLGNVTNDAQIPKSIGTAKGSLVGFTAAGLPADVPVGNNDKVLTADSTQASGVAWKDAPAGNMPVPATDLSYSGIPLHGIAGAPLAFGQAVYQDDADGRLYAAKADAAGTMGAVGIIVVGGEALDEVTYIDNGYIRKDAWNWTPGSSSSGKLYVSTTLAGDITQTAPITVGHQLQELGYAYSADIIRVKINSLLVEIGTGLVDLTSEVAGVLPAANGGAGTVSGIMKADGSGAVSAAAAGTDYVAPGGTTIRIPHSWTMLDAVDGRTFPGFTVSLPAGQTAKLVKCAYRLGSGTSVGAKLTKNGSDITGFTGISVTTTPASTEPVDVDLADGDYIALVTDIPTGTPIDLSFTLFVEYTK
jgi:hypothetical protein